MFMKSVSLILRTLHIVKESYTAWKVSKYGVFSGPYFPAFGLNTERYGVRIRYLSRTYQDNLDGKKQTNKILSKDELFRGVSTTLLHPPG